MCSGDSNSAGASYQGMSITCEACGSIANCAEVTCTDADDASCTTCEQGWAGATCENVDCVGSSLGESCGSCGALTNTCEADNGPGVCDGFGVCAVSCSDFNIGAACTDCDGVSAACVASDGAGVCSSTAVCAIDCSDYFLGGACPSCTGSTAACVTSDGQGVCVDLTLDFFCVVDCTATNLGEACDSCGARTELCSAADGSGSCDGAGVCGPLESCSDGVQNQNELDIDCGGVCPACNVDCVESTEDRSACTMFGQDLYTETTPSSGNGVACTGSSYLCSAGDGSVAAVIVADYIRRGCQGNADECYMAENGADYRGTVVCRSLPQSAAVCRCARVIFAADACPLLLQRCVRTHCARSD